MAVDQRLSLSEDTERLVNHNDIVLFDMTGFSYKHITKLSLSVLRCYMKFTQVSETYMDCKAYSFDLFVFVFCIGSFSSSS